MSGTNGIHDLLPAYVAETLASEPAARFREHLDTCDVCRRELAFLEQVREGAREHGAAFFADHPEVEDIVAAASEDERDIDADVRRHLEFCATCAAEVAWVRGPVADLPRARPARPHGSASLGWAAAVAAMVLLGVTVVLRAPSQEQATAPISQGFVAPSERAGGTSQAIPIAPEARSVVLTVLVDLPADAYPATVELLDSRGETLARDTVASPDRLVEGFYHSLHCGIEVCPPGSYTVRIGSGSGAEHTVDVDLVPRD